ncbi:hypothetical protein RZN05_18935 [Sphingomonas sp. HF-S4]|uniref:Uncharacterized protein n=1 Tax=Sphingomonas agrestis TaxID=3080540 RepID=A0ABU3YCG1_9SPHN|nr:hypothetical protein [Sphingomonas sp. HF-S4]MDV3459081.1 hypothetical protein [Sphingomonas sp. HF-S4]
MSLNPRGQAKKKQRPIMPIPPQMAGLLDKTAGFDVSVYSVRKAFEAMQAALLLPGDARAGSSSSADLWRTWRASGAGSATGSSAR